MTTALQKFTREVGFIFAVVIILIATMMSVAKLATPILNDHLNEIENKLSQIAHQPIKIKHIDLLWKIYKPELVLQNIEVRDADSQIVKLIIPKATVKFSLFRSLVQEQLILENLILSDVNLIIKEEAQGQFAFQGFQSFSIADYHSGNSLDKDKLFQWLFLQNALELENLSLHFIPLMGQAKTLIAEKIILSNTGNRHTLHGDAKLISESPVFLQFKLKWQGNIINYPHLPIQFSVLLNGVNFADLLKNSSWQPKIKLLSGNGDLRLSGAWDGNSLTSAKATVKAYNLKLQGDRPEILSLLHLSGNFQYQHNNNQMILSGDHVLVDLSHRLWPAVNFIWETKQDASHELKINYLNIADTLNAANTLGFVLPNGLNLLKKGELFNTFIKTNKTVDLEKTEISTDFKHIATSPTTTLPGVNELSGALVWKERQGQLSVNSHHFNLIDPARFSSTLELNNVKALLQLKKDTLQQWSATLNSLQINNADVTTDVNAELFLPTASWSDAIINLRGSFAIYQAANIRRYLPDRMMNPDLVFWLQQAFLKGQVVSGKMTIRGKMSEFPFDNKKGEFVIRGDVKDMTLRYAPDWPLLTHLDGMLQFGGREMTIISTRGQLLNIQATSIQAVIPYLGGNQPQILSLQGKLQGDLSEGMRFIHDSPLEKGIGKELAALQLKGPMALQLSLRIPLNMPDNTNVNGIVSTENAFITLPEWNLNLSNVKGAFQFTENDIKSGPFHALLFDQPTLFSLSTTSENQLKTVIVDMSGQLSVEALRQWLALPPIPNVSGETQYTASLHFIAKNKTLPSHITLHSDLRGVSIVLPASYGKSSEMTRDLLVNLLLDDPLLVTMHYADLFSTQFGLHRTAKNDLAIVGGDFSLGNKPAVWDKKNGWLITGDLEKIDWDALQPALIKYVSNNQSTEAWNANFFRGVDVSIQSLALYGQAITNLHFILNKNDKGFEINITSPEISGEIRWPLNNGIIETDFKYIHLTTSQTATATRIVPTELPALNFRSENLRLNDTDFGHVSFHLQPTKMGVTIQELAINSDIMQLHANGSWQKNRGSTESHFTGHLKMSNVANFLANWGLALKNLVGSGGKVDFDLTWPNAPFNPTVATVGGDLSIQLTEGRIINLGDSTDAKIGLGRLLNLLNFQSIPRRLSLDFSDLFEQGYSFDTMKGDFELHNGNIFTQNTFFNGPVARVEINGRIGLVDKDLDIKMAVTPYVTSSLPVVAALAINPLAGVATWMVDKVVSHAMSNVTTYNYVIKGSWENPTWGKP